MYFLFEACQNPDILRVLFFVRQFLNILTIVLPIGLIVMLMVDFAKATISQESEQLKSTKLVGKRIIYAVIVFLVPWIVRVVMNILDTAGLGVEYTACISNSGDIETIEYYQGLQDATGKYEEIKQNDDPGEEPDEEPDEETGNNSQGGSSNNSPTEDRVYEEAATRMLENARKEIGHEGGNKYSGLTESLAWCAYFTVWNLKNTTVQGVGTVYSIVTKEGPLDSESMAGGSISSFNNHSNLKFYYSKQYGGSYTPKKGDIIYFWFPNRNQGKYWDKSMGSVLHCDHVGLVNYYDGTIHTIEGNTGGGEGVVGAKTYQLNDSNIMGYGSWYTSN